MATGDGATVAEPVPGQMWRWTFTAGDGSWMCEPVTESRRSDLTGGIVFVKRDDVFTVIMLDDPGPFEVPTTVELNGCLVSRAHKRWHVVLLDGRLVWFEHEWFEQARFVC